MRSQESLERIDDALRKIKNREILNLQDVIVLREWLGWFENKTDEEFVAMLERMILLSEER